MKVTRASFVQNLLYFAGSRSHASAFTLHFYDKPTMTKRFSALRRSCALSWRLNLLLCSVIACAAPVLCGNMLRAQSNGAAWRQVLPDSLPTQQIVRISANDSAVFALGRGTAYRVENNRLVPFTLPNQQYLTMYATRSFHFAISNSNLWRSQNGRDWTRVGMLPSGVFFMSIIASENEKIHYAATSKGIYQSSDSGRTWQSAWLSSTSVLHFAIVADTIYAYGFGQCCPLQRSTDGGKTWKQELLFQHPSLSQSVYKFVSFLNGIYALIGLGNIFGEIHRFDSSKDMLAQNALTILGNRFRYGLSSLTVRKGEMLCGVLKEPEIRSIVLRSTDGQRWDSLTSKGLDSIRFIEDIAANSRAIFITSNNGMSLYTLDAPTTTVAVRESAPFTTEWRINHQPTNNALLLTVQLPSAAHVRCTLHTALGQEIATLADNAYAAGAHEITTTPQGMASGLYLCRLAVDGRVVGSKSVIVTR